MSDERVKEENLTPYVIVLESTDIQAVDDRASFLSEIGWKETSRTFDAGKVRAMLERAA